MASNTFARSLHDIGLATWFGGSLAGAVAVNGAAGEVNDPRERARVANAGWAKWTPVNLAGIGAHALGALALTRANRGRMIAQESVATTGKAKALMTFAALAATAYARAVGQKVMSEGDVPVEGGTEPSAETPPEVAHAQRQLHALQWAIPALTGALVVMNALMGEQQRPSNVARGLVGRLT